MRSAGDRLADARRRLIKAQQNLWRTLQACAPAGTPVHVRVGGRWVRAVVESVAGVDRPGVLVQVHGRLRCIAPDNIRWISPRRR